MSPTPIIRRLAPAALVTAALACVCAGALALRLRGRDWPDMHPDSGKIGRWIRQTLTLGYIRNQFYPGGFFVLASPVLAVDAAMNGWRPAMPGPEGEPPRVILLARTLNAWLGTASCLLIFAIARHMSGSCLAGLAAAALLAVAPFHVEHCHYAQTDAAMLFMLLLSYGGWIVFVDRPGTGRFCTAAAVSGFAAGTKPVLLLLVLVVAVFAFLWRRGKGGAAAAVGMAALGLACMAAGWVAANPVVYLAPATFLGRLVVDLGGVYSETPGVLGPAEMRFAGRFLHQCAGLANAFRLGGWAVIGLAVAGCAGPGRAAARRYWPLVWVFPCAVVLFLLLAAPWIRVQESFALYPAVFCAAGFALAGSGRMGRLALPAMFAVALAVLLRESVLRVGLFDWRDTRLMAQDWLQHHWPYDARLGLDRYTRTVAGRQLPVPLTESLGEIELLDADHTGLGECLGYLHNETMPGRGLFDYARGALHPQYADALAALHAKGELACRWTPWPQDTPATFAFACPSLALYGRPPSEGRAEAAPTLPRPILLKSGSRLTFFAQGHLLGSAKAVRMETKTRIGIGGPFPPQGVSLVFKAGADPLALAVAGMGARKNLSLVPGECAVLRVGPRKWSPAVTRFERIVVRSLGPIGNSPGIMAVAFDRDEVRCLQAMLGPADSPDRSVICSERDAAGGVRAGLYDMFARLNLMPHEVIWSNLGPRADGGCEWELRMPVLMPRGRFTVELAPAVFEKVTGPPWPAVLAIAVPNGVVEPDVRFAPDAAGRVSFAYRQAVVSEFACRLVLDGLSRPWFWRHTIRWELRDRLRDAGVSDTSPRSSP